MSTPSPAPQKFGRYEVVRELHRGVRGSVYAARLAGTTGEPQYVIKTFRLRDASERDIASTSAHSPAVEAEAFVEQARLQQELSEAENATWAPVYAVAAAAVDRDDARRAEPKSAPKEFYRVGKLFPRSAQDLIAGKVRLPARQLQQLMTGIVRGLLRAHRHARRAHGNLKPSNVLIDGEGRGRNQTLLAALTDPLPSRELTSAHTETRDLADAGRLLHALVSHRWSPGGGTHGEVEFGSEWERFGRHAAAWQALCRRMLDAQPGGTTESALTCEAVLAELERLAPKDRLPLLRIALPAAVTVILAAGLFLWWSHDPEVTECSPNWKRGWAEFDAWFQYLAVHQDGTPANDTLQSNAHLKTIIQQSQERSPFNFASGVGSAADHAQRNPSKRRLRAMDELLVEMDQTRESLKQWPVIEHLDRHAVAFQSNAQTRGSGWSRAAGHLREVIANATPPAAIAAFDTDCESDFEPVVRAHRKDVRAGLVAALEVAQAMEAMAKHEESLAGKLETIRAAAIDDAVIRGFADMAHQAFDAELERDGRSAADSLKSLAAKTQSIDALAGDIVGVIDRLWKLDDSSPWNEKQIDIDWFHRSPFYATVQANVTEQTTREWMNQVCSAEFARLNPDQDPRKPFEEKLRQAELDLAELADAPDIEDLQQDFNRFLQRIADVRAPRVWSHRTREELKDSLSEADVSFRDFREELDGRLAVLYEKAEDYLKRLQQTPRPAISASHTIESAWQSACAHWIDGQSPVDAKKVVLNLRPFEQVLIALDAAAAPVSSVELDAEWVARAQGIADQRREECLREMAAQYDFRKGRLPRAESAAFQEQLQQTKPLRDYQRWKEQAEQVMADVAEVQRKLDGLHSFDHAEGNALSIAQLNTQARSNSDVFNDLQSALSPVLSRVAALDEIERESSLDRLKDLAQTHADRALCVAAWRRLGELDLWPASVDDLRFERKVQSERILPLRTVSAAIESEVRAQAAARWNRCFEQLESANDIVQAAALMPDFNITAEDIASERSRFNYALVQLKSQISAIESDKATRRNNQAAQRILGDFRANIGAFASNSAVAGLLSELKRVEDEFEKVKPVELDQIGPGASKEMTWTVTRIDGSDDLIECTWTAPADKRSQFANTRADGKPQASSHKLVFRLFRDDDIETPFYISTTEVTLGLLINIIDAHNAWKEFNTLMSGSITATAWEGPRVWMKEQAGLRLLANPEWLADQHWGGIAKKYVAPPHPPSFNQPVQHIPAPVAAYIARLLNCRFPASHEWTLAYSNHRQAREALKYIEDTANVRDATWLAQWNHVAEQGKDLIQGRPRNVASCWPDRGSHWPANRAKPEDAAAPPLDAIYTHDDGALWFRPIAVDGSFHDLIGNVAEYVFDDVGAVEASPLNKLDSLFRSKLNRLGVIGGSALSDRRIPVDVPQPIEAPRLVFPSYSDVGFRLAFSAPGARVKYLAEQVHEVLNQQESWFVIAKR